MMKQKNLLRVMASVAMAWLGGVTTSAQEKEAYAVVSDGGETVTFYYDTKKVERGGGAIQSSLNENIYWSATTAVFDASIADYRPTSTAYWFNMCASLTTITGLNHLNTSQVTDMTAMFHMCFRMQSLDVSSFDTRNVTSMAYMFENCGYLQSLDVKHFNTSQVTNMAGMFDLCQSLTTLDLGNFDTRNVTDMRWMFARDKKLTSINISNFDTSKVTDMVEMFTECQSLTTLDVSRFNTGNVTDMSGMFEGCSHLESLDLSHFDTGKVEKMEKMFSDCGGLTTLDLSNFNTKEVKDMTQMFHRDALTAIYVDEAKWSTEGVTESSNMFWQCFALVGGNGTKYDAEHTDKEYARIDKPGQPGYLTQKSSAGIKDVKRETQNGDRWYTLGGQRVTGEPSQRGVYVNGGRKVVRK